MTSEFPVLDTNIFLIPFPLFHKIKLSEATLVISIFFTVELAAYGNLTVSESLVALSFLAYSTSTQSIQTVLMLVPVGYETTCIVLFPFANRLPGAAPESTILPYLSSEEES